MSGHHLLELADRVSGVGVVHVLVRLRVSIREWPEVVLLAIVDLLELAHRVSSVDAVRVLVRLGVLAARPACRFPSFRRQSL